MKTFKLGLDIHGVLDAEPSKFVALAKSIIATSGEVWICTGSSHTPELEQQLLSYCPEKWWTGIFSITDYLKSQGVPHIQNLDGGIRVDDYMWDRVKGDWAIRNEITLHIDDSPVYGQYFPPGVYLKYNERKKR